MAAECSTRPVAEPSIGSWTTGMCGCLYDAETCFCTLCCPCVQVGRNVEIITDGMTDCVTAGAIWYLISLSTGGLCGFAYLCGNRTRLRRKYALPEQPCGDCLTTFCCGPCALCQEARELKNRGWTLAKGYAGNMETFHARGHAPPAQAMYK